MPLRHFSPFCIASLIVLTLAGRSTAQTYTCALYAEIDCRGEILITVQALSLETCYFWLTSPGYSSFLLDPEGDATCFNQDPLPVELTSFQATVVGDIVRLAWTTASETNNVGFEIEHRAADRDFEQLEFVAGSGTSMEPRSYSYDVQDLEPNRHIFRLKQIDFDGSFEYSSEVEALLTVPDRFVLEPAYPNPFNPSTTVRFAVEVEQRVHIILSDAQGRLVATLFEGLVRANESRSVSIDGSNLSSGAYVVTLIGRGFRESVGLQLVK